MTEKLKIGILSNSLQSPDWVMQALLQLEKEDLAEISLIVLKDQAKPSVNKGNRLKTFLEQSNLLYKIYYKFDEKLSRLSSHPMRKRSFNELSSSFDTITALTKETKFREEFSKETLDIIQSYQLDVLLCRGFKILTGDILKAAKHGVWSFHHGDNKINRGSPAIFWEMFNHEKKAGFILQRLTEELDNGQIIEKSCTGIPTFSISKNLSRHYWKSSRVLYRAFSQLHEKGAVYAANQIRKYQSDHPYNFYCYPLYKHPSNLQTLKFIFSLVGRYAKKRLTGLLKKESRWHLRIGKATGNDMPLSFWRYKKLNIPNVKHVADPFIIEKDGRTVVYCEVWDKPRAGRINAYELNRKAEVIHTYSDVVSSGHHMSFPSLLEYNGELYMIPESADSQKLIVYRCTHFPESFETYATIFEDGRYYDPHMFYRNGRFWLFVNECEHPQISSNEELFLYWSDSIKGPWNRVGNGPVCSDVRYARMAGSVLVHGDRLFRLSQDCSDYYGKAINIFEILELNPDSYNEQLIEVLEPHWDDRLKGMHTLNRSENYAIIDAF